MGLNFDCPQLEEEKKFINVKLREMDNKKVGFEVICRGETHIFTPE